MIFRQWQQVLNGTKTQTRRIIKPNELASGSRGGGRPKIHAVWVDTKNIHDRRFECHGFIRSSLVVVEQLYRLKWAAAQGYWADKTYAVQPGRGKKAVGRIRLLGIRPEPLWDIDGPDCLAEGLSAYDNQGTHKTVLDLFDEYAQLWDSIYGKLPGLSWADNPEVWVLEFEVVNEDTI